MRLRSTLVLAAVFLALGAYVYFFELQKERSGKGQKLLPFKPEEADGLVLSTPQHEIRLKREPAGRWRITHPLQAPADAAAVHQLLATLSGSEITRTVEEKPAPEDLKNFGLDRPAAEVSIALQSGLTLPPLRIGARTPVGGSAYVRRGNEPQVFLTSASVQAVLDKKLNDFRDRRILDIKEDAIRQFSIEGADKVLLVKEDEGWRIEKPKAERASQAEVKAWLSALANLSAVNFFDGAGAELKKYGLDRPRLKITLGMGEKQGQREILFGKKREGSDETYVALDARETVYTVYDSAVKELEKDWSGLREKTPDREREQN